MINMDYEKAFKRIKDLSEQCSNCKFVACEQCEINATDIQALRIVLGNYEALQNMYNASEKELKIKTKMIDLMSEQLIAPIHSKHWIIKYLEEKTRKELKI